VRLNKLHDAQKNTGGDTSSLRGSWVQIPSPAH
jgi:hypothetical protein